MGLIVMSMVYVQPRQLNQVCFTTVAQAQAQDKHMHMHMHAYLHSRCYAATAVSLDDIVYLLLHSL